MQFGELGVRDTFNYGGSRYQRIRNVYVNACCSPDYNAVLLDMPYEDEFMALFPEHADVELIKRGEKMSTVIGNARTVPVGGTVMYQGQKLFRTMGTPSAPGQLTFCDEDGKIVEIYTYALVEIILGENEEEPLETDYLNVQPGTKGPTEDFFNTNVVGSGTCSG